MALMNKYLKGCSPYILELTYNLDKREAIVICARDTVDWNPGKRLTFQNVTSFKEELLEDAFDEDLIDSIMGLRLLSESRYCLNTEKRELILTTTSEPLSVDID